MSFYILTANCEIISRTTVARVTNLEKKIEENIKLISEFDESVDPRLNDELILGEQHDREYAEAMDRVYNDDSIPEVADIPTPDIDDCYLNMELASRQVQMVKQSLVKSKSAFGWKMDDQLEGKIQILC
jgi:hypothetical protein